MRGRGRILVVGAVVVVVIVAAALARRPSPARWKGKTAAEWFKEFRTAGVSAPVPVGPIRSGPGAIPVPVRMVVGGRVWTLAVPPGTTRMAFADSPELMLRDASAEGLRELGSNTAIFLSGELRKKDWPFADSYARLYAKAPAAVKKVLPSPGERSAFVRRDAAVVLAALGTNAWPAVPGLISALTKASVGDWNHFKVALKRLPFEDETWDPALDFFNRQQDDLSGIELVRSIHSRTRMAAQVVAKGLLSTNGYVTEAALDEVGGFGQRAELIIPALVVAWESGDPTKRQRAFAAFAKLGPRAAAALPNVLKGLEDKDDEVRYEAARVLETMGTNALPGLEALRRATNDSSVMVQRASLRALEKLCGNQESVIRD